jgi:predicted alpha-1,2-mannosidase
MGYLVNAQHNYTSFVNPFIGTGGHGHTFPGATLPFAMVQLSPDTRIDGSWDGCSGYHYSDTFIYGFSHTHLSGTGCSDYGDIAFMPTFVSKPIEPIYKLDTLKYGFSHKNEVSKAGYYSVKLDNGILVELTSTLRVGIQQYTYTQNGYAWITLNLKHRDELLEGKISEINKHSFSGLRRSKAWAENQLIYYYFEVNRDAEQIIIGKDEFGETKVNLGYKVKAGDKILIKTSLSSVDEIGAKKNMEAELNHWRFENIKSEANRIWNEELNKIKVYGGTKDEKVNFYSALYHCMIHPNIMNDADGRYMGRDKKIHMAEGFNYYTVFSLWDTYRALHPLLNIIDKERSHDFIKTFQLQYEQSGRLPMWELWGNETNCMIGFHSVSVILDAYRKGAIDLQELNAIYPAVKAEAMSDRFGLDKYREKGFLSIEDESESVSKTLEYSYDFYCVSEIASLLYLTDDTKYFKQLSEGWRNVYDINSQFMTPRKNGGWLNNFDPKRVDNNYTEANAWQYSFAVPQEYWKFSEKVTQIFNTDSKTSGREQSDISGLIGQYAHGNEPSHHIPYLFNNLDSTTKYLWKICTDLYKPLPEGLCGNEDCGQMSAWYVFSAMGFYPVNPATNTYLFGNMIFDSVKISTKAHSLSVYKKLSHLKSNRKFGVKEDDLAKSNSFNLNLDTKVILIGYDYWAIDAIEELRTIHLPSPIINSESSLIKDSLSLVITYNDDNYHDKNIYFKINNQPYIEYTLPIVIKENCKVAAYVGLKNISDKKRYEITNDTSFAYFSKKPNDYTINIKSTYNDQYTADGDQGLIDGLLGDTDWRKGRWQGYQGQDFEAIIDLREKKNVHLIKASFLQDTRSWIIFPPQVNYFSSEDGIEFTEIGNINNTVSDANYLIQRQAFTAKVSAEPFRFIKIVARNYGKLPPWHQGANGDAFIFIDEIVIE